MYKKLLLSTIIFASIINAGEVSVFGAGNLESANPYGLTNTEKYILKNKKELGSIDTKVKSVKTNLELINERIDGIESLYEGDSQKLNQTVLKLNEFLKDFEVNRNNVQKNSEDIQNIKTVVDQFIQLNQENQQQQKENIEILKKALDDLTVLVNDINKKYVSDKELKSNMSQFLTQKDFEIFRKDLVKDLSNLAAKKVTSSKKINEKKSKKEIFNEAKEMFKNNHLTKSIPMWEYLIEVKYKPAESNYHLGEIWYFKKEYDKAISYFKTSAMLYDKGWWMPKLLLHSAISFEKKNDIDNAANFYNTLINMYPDSKEAAIAKENIK